MASENSSITYANGTTVSWTRLPTTRPPTPSPAPRNISEIDTSKGDTCGCVNGQQRLCDSCLDSVLPREGACVVTPTGLCMSASRAAMYASSFSQLNLTSTNAYQGATYAYCSRNDSECQSCRTRWLAFYKANGTAHFPNTMCYGAGGCICTAFCTLRAEGLLSPQSLAYDAGIETCFGMSSGSSDWSTAYAEDVALMRNITFLLCGAVLVIMTVRSAVAQFHQRRFEHRMRVRRQALRAQREGRAQLGLMLSLDGWNSYREQLIEREQEHLGLKPDAIALSQTPARVQVEAGDGFRPASPSELARHQVDREV